MNAPGPVLRDIHPATVSWWPPAYGWWVLAAVTIVVLALGVRWTGRWLARRRRMRRAARQIAEARERYRQSGNITVLAGELSHWLRRAARLYDPASVRLEGDAWQQFLDQHAPRGMDASALASLDAVLYRPATSIDDAGLTRAVHAWVRHAMARA